MPTAPAAPPGLLDVKVRQLDLGATGPAGTITVTNVGGQPVGWSTSSDNGLVRAPGRGSLGPGASVRLTISVSRSGLVEGDYTGVVSVTGGGRSVPVTVHWKVEHPPVVEVTVAPPALDDAGTCSKRSGALTGTVTALVTDESAVASVSMAYTGPGTAGAAALLEVQPGTWTATLGPLDGPGAWTVIVTTTDGRGNVGTGTVEVAVSACPR